MKTYRFEGLLQNEGWICPAFVQIDQEGKVVSISKEQPTTDIVEQVNGYAVPGFQNAHSHGFQYAMAGLAEKHAGSANPDDFWGWREAMYQLALSVNPDQMEDIATMLYAEMLRHGYTNVAEFHYVHHDKDGKPYENLAEMGARMIAAAQKTGMKITLVPIFYQKGGFGKAPNDRQRRFISPTIDAYYELLNSSRENAKHYQFANVGYGIHSMRGVEPEDIKIVAQQAELNTPFHIHIAEQLKEIEDSVAYLGKRPVEWLCDNVELNNDFHLVHATHLTEKETVGIARGNANVVICPSTEGNLGDGIFPLKKFQDEGGNWSIGTDSHIGLNPLEELRILDYGQRLTSHKRNSFYSPQQGDGGMYAFEMATKAGRKAMGNDTLEFFKTGVHFDAAVIDATAPLVACSQPENLTSTIVYSTDVSMQLGTIVNGEWKVKNGKHLNNDKIVKDFTDTIGQLGNR